MRCRRLTIKLGQRRDKRFERPLPANVDTAYLMAAQSARVYDISGGGDRLAQFAEWFLDRPIDFGGDRGAWLLSKLCVARSEGVTHIVTADRSSTFQRLDRLGVPVTGLIETEEDPPSPSVARPSLSISNVLGSGSVAVWSIGFTTALGTIGINLGPLSPAPALRALVSVSAKPRSRLHCRTVYVARDQYGIGDVIDLGEAVGVVEVPSHHRAAFAQRHRVACAERPGVRVGNLSQLWSVAVIDIDVAYDMIWQKSGRFFKRRSAKSARGRVHRIGARADGARR